MKHFSFDQKVLCGIVAFLLVLLTGGTLLIVEMGRQPLEASESIVEVVTSNEEKLEAAAKAIMDCYSGDILIVTTEGTLDEHYYDIEGTYAVGMDEDAPFEQVTNEDIIYAANLQNFNSS